MPESDISQPTCPGDSPSVRRPYQVSITTTNGEQNSAHDAMSSTILRVGASERTWRKPSANPPRRAASCSAVPTFLGASVQSTTSGHR